MITRKIAKGIALFVIFVVCLVYFSFISRAADRGYYTVVDEGFTNTLDHDLQDWVYEMCDEYEIPGYEKLIIAKLYCESSYRTHVKHSNTNGTYDIGIAQINSINFEHLKKELGVTDFTDPKQSIRCGVYMMAKNLQANNYDENKALVAYNAGQKRVDSGITETSYSRRVLKIKKDMEVQNEAGKD